MEHVFGQGRISADQQNVGAVKEKTPFSCSEVALRFEHKPGHPIVLPYLERDGDYRRTAGTGQVGLSKYQRPWLGDKSCSGDYDELVKHMSNLPGFLQRVEKENSIQEKALNFGVLEWKRLESWKYTERMPRNPPKRTSSSNKSVRTTSGPPKISRILRNESTSDGHNSTSFYSGKHPLPCGPSFVSPPRQPPLHDYSYLNLAKDKKNASCHEEEKYGRPAKLKGKEIYNQAFHESQTGIIGRQQACRDQRLLFNLRSSETDADHRQKNDLMEEVISGKDVSVSGLGKHKFSASSASKINSLGKKSVSQSGAEPKFTTGSSCIEAGPQTIVLPVPNHRRSNSSLEGIQFMECRTSVDGNFSEMSGNRLSDFSSIQEFDLGELSGDSSHSCPLPSASSDPTWCSAESHNVVDSSQAIGSETHSMPIQSVKSPFSTKSGSKDSAMHKETSMSSCSIEDSNKRPVGLAEKPIVRGRASSPTQRFSFDLGRMGRSFSFKDNTVLPQLNSTDIIAKSGKVRPEVRFRTDNVGRDKEAGTSRGRGRSSPLRRLLDPLLKHKGTEAAEVVRPPKPSMPARTISAKGKSQDRKSDASLLQALLQLTLKNGRPCFKLVVDNSDNMLAAAVKNLPTSGKSDRCMIYTFYSVREIRKKSMAWITQGSKSKNCSLGYDIVGQMKISNTNPVKGNAGSSSETEATECVLYGANPGQLDKQAVEFASSREVAAIIVKNSIKGLDDGQLHGENQSGSVETLDMGENKKTNGTLVILPGGIHGTPIKGTPSSLISRWKSGGLCDCGGWDVGCQLRVLADDKINDISNGLTCTSNANRLNLFLPEGEQKKKHAFSLDPIGSGLYSVEFDTSISLLEAFGTCVAYVTCQKFPDLIDIRGESDAEQRTAQNITHTPCPPLSPAGRI